MERKLTCIVCPLGCELTVKTEGKCVAAVAGNTCPKGKAYAENECTNPQRTVTSTVRCECGDVVAVKTERAIPKELVFAVMGEINSTLAKDGLKVGDVVIENVCGTGVNVVATANHR
jgi:CxxC motif-containing protein